MNTKFLPEHQETYSPHQAFIFPGSFDPWTYGHTSVVEDFFKIFPQGMLLILVAKNPKKQYLFSPEQRKILIENSLQKYGEYIRVEIYDGVVSEYAYLHQARAIIKGVRDGTDCAYEIDIARANTYFSSKVQTLLLPQLNQQAQNISSSTVKTLFDYGADTHTFISAPVREALRMKQRGQMLIGVTGGTGSGKSQLAQSLVEYSHGNKLPVYHIDIDRIVHELYQKPTNDLQQSIHQKLSQVFGGEIVGVNGEIDRKKLGRIVFSDTEKKGELEHILSEAFVFELRRRLQSLGDPGVILLDWALFVEYNLGYICDENFIMVDAHKEVQRSRIIQRDALSFEAAEMRIQNQYPSDIRKKYVLERQRYLPDRCYGEYYGDTREIPILYNALQERYQKLKISFGDTL